MKIFREIDLECQSFTGSDHITSENVVYLQRSLFFTLIIQGKYIFCRFINFCMGGRVFIYTACIFIPACGVEMRFAWNDSIFGMV